MASDDIQTNFLESKPLMGYEINTTHLTNVLQTILRNQQQFQAQMGAVSRRMGTVEQLSSDFDRRLQLIEQQLFGGEDSRQLKVTVNELSTTVASLIRRTIPELRRDSEDLKRFATTADRDILALTSAIRPVEVQVKTLEQSCALSLKDHEQHLNELRRQLQVAQQQQDARDRSAAEVLRDVQGKTDRLEREVGGRWRESLEELNERMNENFRLIEEGARAVDVELAKLAALRTDVSNLRTELNTVDNQARYKVSKVAEDVDAKFKELLEFLQSVERNSTMFEEHLAAAGRALVNTRYQPTVTASHSNLSTPGSLFQPTARETTTTSTALRGGRLFSNVRQNLDQ